MTVRGLSRWSALGFLLVAGRARSSLAQSVGDCTAIQCNGGSVDTANRQISIPLDDAWTLETYDADKTSDYGARGFTGVRTLHGGRCSRLAIAAHLVARDRSREGGEIFRPLSDIPGLSSPADLDGAVVEAVVRVSGGPRHAFGESHGIPHSGLQVILETKNTDGLYARRYGQWMDLETLDADTATRARLRTWNAAPRRRKLLFGDGTFTEPGFTPGRSVRIGLKYALNVQSEDGYRGTVYIDSVRILLPRRTRRRPSPSVPTDRLLAGLHAPPLDAGENVLANTSALKPASRVEVTLAPFGRDKGMSGVAVAHVTFDHYDPAVDERSVRIGTRLPTAQDLGSSKVVAYVAVGPRLRGTLARPNQVQLELYDSHGRVLRGPASSVSGSVLFDERGRPRNSTWVAVEVSAPIGTPMGMGFAAAGFRKDDVVEIDLRFELGKNSQEVNSFPLSGDLLLSNFVLRPIQTRDEGVTSQSGGSPPVPDSSSAHRRIPEPFVAGVNYPFINYGWDVGTVPYGGRTHGGFGSYRHQLRDDFMAFKKAGVDVVRVFLLGDLRTGMVRSATGLPAGLDMNVEPDLEALVEAASASGVHLLPSLVDFLAADGSARKDLGNQRWRWSEGEAVDVFTDPAHRRAFLDNVLRPVVQFLAHADERQPGLVYAIEIMNEPENALALMTPDRWRELRKFVKQGIDLVHMEAPRIPVTLGSRDPGDLVEFWRGLNLDLWQFHFYDKAAEEEGRSLDVPAKALGLPGPVIVGELEGTSATEKLDLLARNGYAGAFFWSHLGQDGYTLDLDAIRRWKAVQSKSTERIREEPR